MRFACCICFKFHPEPWQHSGFCEACFVNRIEQTHGRYCNDCTERRRLAEAVSTRATADVFGRRDGRLDV